MTPRKEGGSTTLSRSEVCSFCFRSLRWHVAQGESDRGDTREVGGSNPPVPANLSKSLCADITQLAECRVEVEKRFRSVLSHLTAEVAGSTPAVRSKLDYGEIV